MDKVFVDTNVMLDYLAARPPFDKDAKTLMQRAELGQIEFGLAWSSPAAPVCFHPAHSREAQKPHNATFFTNSFFRPDRSYLTASACFQQNPNHRAQKSTSVTPI
ncbi:MAG: hypothetical protein DYG98_16525 [Haliscomenobacteraceae bacterium CHB4]|nr:hypothetical protein [Saprospiraceae bacterium]MCE7924654.1 hypothetical protein [Haliscomenobacteraceae bacterium CHB4]